jgi:cytochrome P450
LLRTVKEVLRLYPPSPAQPRDPLVIQDLGGTRVEPGSYVMLFPYATHRHPDFWKDPERFDPDRFLPDQENGRHPFAYFPFGGGQRICIGNNFAMLEASLLAAHLVRRFRFELLAGARPELEIRGTLTVRKGGLPMRIMRR